MSEDQVRESRISYAAAVEGTSGDTPVAEMTVRELKLLIQSVVEDALREVLGDPDTGLELTHAFEARLRQAEAYVSSGGRLLSMDDLVGEIED